jgi:hypothetical protein
MDTGPQSLSIQEPNFSRKKSESTSRAWFADTSFPTFDGKTCGIARSDDPAATIALTQTTIGTILGALLT